MNALFQTRAITCGCGRSLSVPVLGDVYSLVRESIEAEKREEADLLLKSALDEIDRLRAEIAEAQRDADRYRWLRDSKIADDADRWICAHECTVHEVAELDGERLDAAIDRARGAG